MEHHRHRGRLQRLDLRMAQGDLSSPFVDFLISPSVISAAFDQSAGRCALWSACWASAAFAIIANAVLNATTYFLIPSPTGMTGDLPARCWPLVRVARAESVRYAELSSITRGFRYIIETYIESICLKVPDPIPTPAARTRLPHLHRRPLSCARGKRHHHEHLEHLPSSKVRWPEIFLLPDMPS